eukprot:gene10134-biopygen15459
MSGIELESKLPIRTSYGDLTPYPRFPTYGPILLTMPIRTGSAASIPARF